MKKTKKNKKGNKMKLFIVILLIVLSLFIFGYFKKDTRKEDITKMWDVNGITSNKGGCGPTLNSCSVGKFVDMSDTSSQYKWSCLGAYNEGDANCFVNIKSANEAACGKDTNNCLAGVFIDIADSSSYYQWVCQSANKKRKTSCYSRKPKDGICGKIKSCLVGNYTMLPNSITSYNWKCLGIYGGKSVDCSSLAPCGLTNDAPVNMCNGGTFVDVPDTTCFDVWRCEKFIDTGWNYVCHKTRVFDGVCGTTKNSCSKGSFIDVVDTSTQYKWTCKGCNTGKSIPCSLNK
jgi:hypothetical protein